MKIASAVTAALVLHLGSRLRLISCDFQDVLEVFTHCILEAGSLRATHHILLAKISKIHMNGRGKQLLFSK